MTHDQDMNEIVRMVNGLGSLYWGCQGFQDRATFQSLSSDWRKALGHFLEGYAYEHQGRSPFFSRWAVQALDGSPSAYPDANFEAEVWQEFVNLAGERPVNLRLNPLASRGSGPITICALVRSLDKFNYNLASWACELMSAGRIEEVCVSLQTVRGIGPKIASFYLRDVAEGFEIDEALVGNKALLQPIDIWTRRGATALGRLADEPIPDQRAAEVIIRASEMVGVRSTLTNVGLWFLGAQLVRDADRFQELLLSAQKLRVFLSSEEERARFRASTISNVLNGATRTL